MDVARCSRQNRMNFISWSHPNTHLNSEPFPFVDKLILLFQPLTMSTMICNNFDGRINKWVDNRTRLSVMCFRATARQQILNETGGQSISVKSVRSINVCDFSSIILIVSTSPSTRWWWIMIFVLNEFTCRMKRRYRSMSNTTNQTEVLVALQGSRSNFGRPLSLLLLFYIGIRSVWPTTNELNSVRAREQAVLHTNK